MFGDDDICSMKGHGRLTLSKTRVSGTKLIRIHLWNMLRQLLLIP